jgi:uncharacterized protein with PIN domain
LLIGVSNICGRWTAWKNSKKTKNFGFDNLYLSNTDDDTIIEIFLDGKRVFLTKDRNFTEDRVKQATLFSN